MILLSVDNISKYFGPEPVLDGLSVEIRPGERIGLVGPNGAGKSTLLSILTGQLDPDGGQVLRHPSVGVALLDQHPQFAAGACVWDVARQALARWLELADESERLARRIAEASDVDERRRLGDRFDQINHLLMQHDAYHLDHKIERVLSGLGLGEATYQQPATQLSGGQQNRLLLAQLLLASPEVMLLDEPSNHLDIEATEWLEDFLLASRQALVVVSHDRYLLDKVTNRTWELLHGTIDAYSGNFSAYRQQKAERLEVERRTYQRQQEMIAKTEDFIRKNSYGQKHAQAQDRRKKLERIERVALPREIQTPPMRFPPAARAGDVVIRVEHLAKAFDRPLLWDVTFDVLRGQRWGLLGPNGSGKTTLLRCLAGQIAPDAGRVVLATGVRLAYYDQRLETVADDDLVVDAVRPPHKELHEPQRRDLLARFGITGDQAFQRVGSLSGGERSRVALARLSTLDANLLLLDEPTNHLDLWARDALEQAILAFDGTVLLVSHDRYLLNRVVDHLLVVEPERLRVIEGNYDFYQHLVAQRLAGGADQRDGRASSAARTSSATMSQSAATARREGKSPARKTAADNDRSARQGAAKPARRRFPYRKLADIEGEIFERETRVQEIYEQLAQSEVQRDGAQVRLLREELTTHEEALPQLYEHWEEAAQTGG